MGTPWRLSLHCFLVFTSSFSANIFFCWALQMSHIPGCSANNSLATMLDSDQPSSLALPSSGKNSLTPAAPVTTAPTFTLSQQDHTWAFSQALGYLLPQILAALQSHLTFSGPTTCYLVGNLVSSTTSSSFIASFPLLSFRFIHR